MILDSMTHIGRYRGIHPNLDLAIDYVMGRDLDALPDGRHDIAGDAAYVMISSPALGDNPMWEKHQLYADIQIALRDGESIAWADADSLSGFSPYDEAKGDIQKSHDAAPGVVCALQKGQFGLYFPQDAHRPGLGQGATRKAVVKVKVC